MDITIRLRHFRKMEAHDLRVMQEFNCPIVPVYAKVSRMIKWTVSDVGMLKLNVNGESCGNLGMLGGGGVIWDSQGRVLVGFAHLYGQATNTIVECRALLDGLRLCRSLGLRDLLVESDSTVVVGWMASGISKYWFLWDFWEEVKMLVRLLKVRVRHNFREANMVADFLAKE
ncbi:uncharacterized protein LOC122291135 [Carya illinoinensis]|uniref:uncharacterized protein LOC122291135 n=1 Tax=Carya illinoinensis TaxID=32201 RepID=UPI001C71C81E|nr:uncharacterized protein LOC122291135 [Carya illinoinensis]